MFKLMSVKYRLYRNNISNTGTHRKWYARAVVSRTVGIDEIAARIQDGCTVKRSDVLAVLCELSEAVRDELLAGNRVVLPGLGSFKVGLASAPADTPDEWTPARHLRGAHIVFRPETADSYASGRRSRSPKALRGLEVEELPRYDKGGRPKDAGRR